MRFHGDGVELTDVEPANVASMVSRVDPGALDFLEADGETLGVRVSRLRNVVGPLPPNETVRLDAEGRTLRVRTESVEYSMRLIDPAVLDERRTLDGVVRVRGW